MIMDILQNGINKINLGIKEGKNFSKLVGSIIRNKEFKKEIEAKTKFLDKVIDKIRPIERVWCILNNIQSINDIPFCSYCKTNYVRFEVNSKNPINFSNTCSPKCGNKLGLKKSKRKESIKKAELTKKKVLLKKYGVDHVSKIPGINKKKHETAIKNYGNLKNAFHETSKNVIIKKYGVDNISKLPEVKRKKIETSLKQYGSQFPWQSINGKQQQKNGVIKKYGVDNISKLDSIKEKKRQTCLDKYEVDNFSKTIEFIESMSKENNHNWKGGISNNGYCDIFLLKEFKDMIMHRDGYKCLNPSCNKNCSDDLVIHHIDYNKMNCHTLNLITLCRSCNTIANFNREWHTSWYNALINNRYVKSR